jgi:hypothetical protein
MDFAVLEPVVPQVHWYDPFGFRLLVVAVSETFVSEATKYSRLP